MTELSPIAKKIKEAMLEFHDEFDDEGELPSDKSRQFDEIAHRKAKELYISDEEIDELAEHQSDHQARVGNGIVDGYKKKTASLWAKWLRDRLFKPKNDE